MNKSILWIFSIFYLILSVLLRGILWEQFNTEEHFSTLIMVIGIGFINDLIQLLYLLLPFSLLSLILPQKYLQKNQIHYLLAVLVFSGLYGMLFISVAEYYFFEEFNARFNLVAVDYLRYPHEIFVNIWQSYPVSYLLTVVFIVTSVLFYPIWLLIKKQIDHFLPLKQRIFVLALHGALVFLASGLFSTHYFDFSDNRITNEITVNGLSSFFKALRTEHIDYPTYYRTENKEMAFRLLTKELAKGGGQFTQIAEKSLTRRFTGNPQGLGKLNVVVIVEESFGAEFIGAYGDNRHLTPAFDQLAQQGMLFTQAWATGTRTVRGLEAITLSFPPIPSEAVIKRQGNENMTSWGKIMREQGYQSSFLYGGYGYFDNMTYFYEHNGFIVRDRQDIKSPQFTNIWGVSDADLLRYATDYYDQLAVQQVPFFSIIMTTSNHKPFTFPTGIPGVASEGGGREAGIRYADYALGQFLREARHHAWFQQTLFVIVADHGARVYGKAEIPLHSYKIPLLLFSPNHVIPVRIDREISQIDIAPTVLGLLGLAYEAPFFGQNVLQLAPHQPSTLFFNHNYTVALKQNDKLVLLDLHQVASEVNYDSQRDRFTVLQPDSQVDLAIAYYQIAFELFKKHLY